MSIITSQQLNKYYASYRTIDVTFNKELIRASGLNSRQVYFKYKQGQRPCIIYSTSMAGAKIITSLDSAIFKELSDQNNLVSLRFSFIEKGAPEPIFFFVQARITGFTPVNKDKPDLYFATLEYTQRPPDDLIQIVGSILDAAINAKSRAEERITITEEANRKLSIDLKKCFLLIDRLPRKCILRDISFSGAKAILMGNAKFIVNKTVVLRLEQDNGRTIFQLPGVCLRSEEVEGRKDLTALGIRFADQGLPIEYKMWINDYLSQIRSKKGE